MRFQVRIWVCVAVLALAGTRAMAERDREFRGEYRLVASGETRRVHGVIGGGFNVPQLRALEWVLLAPVPPTHAWQDVHSLTFAMPTHRSFWSGAL